MAKVELKKPIVEEISANIADAQGVVLVNYSGLTVAQDTQLLLIPYAAEYPELQWSDSSSGYSAA